MADTTAKKAVIATGGKQYLVGEGDTITIEKLAALPGEKVVFDSVLLTAKGDDATIGQPYVTGAQVEGKVEAQTRAPKIFGVKFKAKKRYMRYFGHKQRLTTVAITKIVSP